MTVLILGGDLPILVTDRNLNLKTFKPTLLLLESLKSRAGKQVISRVCIHFFDTHLLRHSNFRTLPYRILFWTNVVKAISVVVNFVFETIHMVYTLLWYVVQII